MRCEKQKKVSVREIRQVGETYLTRKNPKAREDSEKYGIDSIAMKNGSCDTMCR